MGVRLDIFSLIYLFSFLSFSLWETAPYRLKYCLKGPLNPKQRTNKPIEQELPDLYPSCAVTRAMAKKAMLTENQSVVDLTDSFIGQSFKNEITRSLYHNLPEHQTDSTDCTSASDHFSSSLVEEDHDIRSRSQRSKEQHKDPEISPLFQKVVSETDLAQDPICCYIKNGILMRKWRSPEIPADDEWAVNQQIVGPKIYRSEILSLAHETPMSGHLGVNKTYHRS